MKKISRKFVTMYTYIQELSSVYRKTPHEARSCAITLSLTLAVFPTRSYCNRYSDVLNLLQMPKVASAIDDEEECYSSLPASA